MQSSCPRCGGSLQSIDDPLAFCPHCGLPQLRVSEDALATHADPSQQQGSPVHQSAIAWPRALRLAAIAAVAGVALPSCLPEALTGGLVAGMALLMTPVLTLAVVFFYLRSQVRALPPAGGARIGALMGLLMGSLAACITGIAGFVLRYHYHSHAIDGKIEQALAQMPAQLSTAGPPPAELLAFLQTPEFRAGTFILGHVISLLILVGAGAICGWLAAAILGRRQAQAG